MDKASSLPAPSAERLTSLERLLLLIPLAGGAVFGLLPYLLTGWFANISGFPGNDHYIYRLAGAATFGYAIALGGALMEGTWPAARLIVIAVLTFNIASLYACISTMAAGGAPTVVYLILATSIIIVAITGYLLYAHRDPHLAADVAQWAVIVTGIALVLALVFGLFPLFAPDTFGKMFGYRATDLFVYRQAAAATLGYGVMGIFQLRCRNWQEWRWPTVMAAAFNAMAFVASVWSIYKSGENAQIDPVGLPILVGLASLAVTIATALVIQREGK